MDKELKERLSFSRSNHTLFQRENWQEALKLLPKPRAWEASPMLAKLPTDLENRANKDCLEWVITDNSHSTSIKLAPYFIDGKTTYRIPSYSHMLNHLTLSDFDKSWVLFFMEHFYADDATIELETTDTINTILWTLARNNRLRMHSAQNSLQIEQPLKLRARLRYSEEWALWTLNAELISQEGAVIEPESLDLLTTSGLVIYQSKLFPLPKGAVWVSQLLTSGSWFIAKASLSEALYQLSHRIHDGEFLRHLSEVSCVQKAPLPIIYLRAKHFDKQTPVTLYLAYRYENFEVFSLLHSQDEFSMPVGFEGNEGSCILYFRDLPSENDAELLIKNEHNITFIANKRAWIVHLSDLWDLIHSLLKRKWEVWAEKHKIEELSSFGINVESKIGWFELQSFDTTGKRLIDPLQLIKYLKRKALFIQLGDDKVCILPEYWINRLTQFLDIGHPDKHQHWCFSSIYATELDTIMGDDPTFRSDEAFRATVEKMRSFGSITRLTQPDGLRAILRPYQLEGLTWLNLLCELHVGGILADDMGIGKTVQILALLQHRWINQPQLSPQTILVVCPKSVQNHWFMQVKNLIPKLSCHILNSSEVVAIANHHPKQHRLLLASYGLIRHHIERLSTWKFDLLILDEAQMIKNEFSQTTQAIKQLNSTQRFALTGTPIENRFEELVSIFTFLNPHAHLNLGPSMSAAEAIRDLVQRALHPFVLRRLKEDVLPDLPTKTIQEIVLPMTRDQDILYQELVETYRLEITKHQNTDKLPTEADMAFFLEALLRLRQVATHPQQLLGDRFKKCTSNKLIYLKDQLPVFIKNGHRIVIFSQFLGFLRDLTQVMQQLNILYSYIDGETTDREREISLFQSNKTIKVLLISLKIGGVGIDLTNADMCIIADPWWNEAVEKQAIDRLHRFNQKKAVSVLRLISKNSIEEKMNLLKQNKNALAEAIGKTNTDFLNHLKWDDFTAIF